MSSEPITVHNQDELDRVLANIETLDSSRTLVIEGPDPDALRLTPFTINKPIPNPIKVGDRSNVRADVPELNVTVDGGDFHSGLNRPSNLVVHRGRATAPRGTSAVADGGSVTIRGGMALTTPGKVVLKGYASGFVDSGEVEAHDNSHVEATGNAQVFAFGKSRVDAFARATVRGDDESAIRTHENSGARMYGKSKGFANGDSVITLVSPECHVEAASPEALLRITDDIDPSQYNQDYATTDHITRAEAKFPDTLRLLEARGRNAYHNGSMAAPALDAEVQQALESLPVGHPMGTAIMEAYSNGFQGEANKAADAVLTEDAKTRDLRAKHGDKMDPSPGELKPFSVTTDEGVRTWQAEDEDHAREQHMDAFPEEKIRAVAVLPPVDKSEAYIVYEDENGHNHYQPWRDVTDVGVLIDPESGEDMEVVGWSKSDNGEVRTDPMSMVYVDEDGYRHPQSWDALSEAGGLIDPENGYDMEMVGWVEGDYLADPSTSVKPVALSEARSGCCAECGGEFIDEDGVTFHLDSSGDNDYDTDLDHVAYSGDSAVAPIFEPETFPLTSDDKLLCLNGFQGEGKTIQVPPVDGIRPEGAVIAMPDETLVKFGFRNGDPVTVQNFNWETGKWGRSMSVAAGAGKALLNDAVAARPDDRKVSETVAAAYGHITSSCLMCGKPLSDSRSLSRGYGASCAGKLSG